MRIQPQQVHEELSRCIIALLLEEPFYGHFLMGVVRRVSEETPTAHVSVSGGQVSLVVNPSFFCHELNTTEERVAVIKHETLHLVLQHLIRFPEERWDRHRLNLAMDLVVNQFIVDPWTLPESAITLASFSKLRLSPNKSVEWYYEKLGQAGQDSQVSAKIEALRRQPWHSDHSPWEQRCDLEASLAETTLERMLTDAAEAAPDHGSLPREVRERIDKSRARSRSTVDWRRALRIFAARSGRTRVVSTTRRPSRRYGTTPGTRVKRSRHLAVALDTSGSITQKELDLFFTEVHAVWQRGTQVTVIECDAQVQRVWSYSGTPPSDVRGRGGTAFDPVFEYVRDRRDLRLDGVVYMTDGYAGAPQHRPPCPLLWVLTHRGKDGEHLRYGRAIRLMISDRSDQ